MKSYNDLLKFYGVEEGCSYIVTKTKKEKYKDFVGNRFVVKRWYKTDEFGILFCGKSMLYYTFLNDFEYELSVLDTIERRYLKNVIEPFKNRVLYIVKHNVDYNGTVEFITIGLKPLKFKVVNSSVEHIFLPYFKSGTMYKGMVPNKRYTLAELGLS